MSQNTADVKDKKQEPPVLPVVPQSLPVLSQEPMDKIKILIYIGIGILGFLLIILLIIFIYSLFSSPSTPPITTAATPAQPIQLLKPTNIKPEIKKPALFSSDISTLSKIKTQGISKPITTKPQQQSFFSSLFSSNN